MPEKDVKGKVIKLAEKTIVIHKRAIPQSSSAPKK